MKHDNEWKTRELLAILYAWLRSGGNLIDALTAWAEVITQQVTPDTRPNIAIEETTFWPEQPEPALKELIEY